jgi:hypothetical protein
VVLRRLLGLAAMLALAAGCSRKPPNATPEGAVREFVDRVSRASVDPTAAKDAYELLSKSTQKNLVERAERFTDASGKHIAPEAMLAPSSFLERFELHELRAEIVGSHALVHAQGLLPEETAEIPCVLEDGGWRIEIPLPPLMPVSKSTRDTP